MIFGGQTTSPILFGASAVTVESAINALTNLAANGSVVVTQAGPTYFITFEGAAVSTGLSIAAQAAFTSVATSLVGNGTPTITVVQNNSNVVVASGASLEMQGGINVGNKFLQLSGIGPLLTEGTDLHTTALGTTIEGTGAVRNINGTNAWSGPVVLAAASAIGSDSGQLTINSIISGIWPSPRVGAGTLEVCRHPLEYL